MRYHGDSSLIISDHLRVLEEIRYVHCEVAGRATIRLMFETFEHKALAGRIN